MPCPHDGAQLHRVAVARGAFVWACPQCQGRTVAITVLRQLVPDATLRALWQRVNAATKPFEGIACPSCQRSTAVINMLRLHWVTFSARTGFVLWLLLQGWLLVEQLYGHGYVSALAHLGGVLVGVLAWAVWRERMPG